VPRFLGREALPLLLVAFYAALLALLAPSELVGDSWLTLVSGREVAQHGIPQHDHLMALSHGARWVDQQWLAQLAFYGLTRLGGLQAAAILHVLLLGGAFALAVTAARRRGASPATVLWVGLVCVFLAPWAWQLRSQSFAYPLFVATLWLLASDSRAPSRRVLLALPLLALWANLHGSVVLGAGLVALRGVTIVFERWRGGAQPAWRLRAALLLAAPLTTLVSPYGTALVGYYRHMLGSPLLSRFVQEWGPTTPSKAWLFYPAAIFAVWLLGRKGSALTLFERAALLAATLVGFVALRHVVWFELAALMFVPVLLDAQRVRKPTTQRLARPVGAASVLALLAIPTALAAAPSSWYARGVPAELRHVSGGDNRVFASETLADWLLWKEPSLRGRIAYDVRFELLPVPELERLSAYHRRSGANWAAPTLPFSVLVLDRRVDSRLAAALAKQPGVHRVFSDRRIVILRRGFYASKLE
jgi:hypothetical protein